MPAFRVVDEHLTAPVLVYSSSGGVFEQEKILTSGTGISINSVSGSVEISANLSVITQEVSQDLARKYLNEIVFNEIPAGIKDGINRTYTLVTAPSDESSIQFWINGQLQTKGDDYSLSLRNISILREALTDLDVIFASYSRSISLKQYVFCERVTVDSMVGNLNHAPETIQDLMLFLNGQLLTRGLVHGDNDYIISGTEITFDMLITEADVVLATYAFI